jgi:glycosyltransferase involved in cell wall biosynthesis
VNTCFSVLMSVYYKEKPQYLKSALRSLAWQTRLDFQFVLVKDGRLTNELEAVIVEYESTLRPTIVELSKCSGLNVALNMGLKFCQHELVVRCDSDDINLPWRFEEQIRRLQADPSLTLLSGPVAEFVSSKNQAVISSLRHVPLKNDLIARTAKYRSPFNHPSVAFRKHSISSVGAYPEARETKMEDYALWLRLLGKGFKCSNIGEPLVLFRSGPEVYERRRGIPYFVDELKFTKERVSNGICTFPFALLISLARAFWRLFPARYLALIYQSFLRSSWCIKFEEEMLANPSDAAKIRRLILRHVRAE